MHQGHFVVFGFKESNLEIVILAELEFLAQLGFRAKGRVVDESGHPFLDGHQCPVFIVFDNHAFDDIALFQFAFKFVFGKTDEKAEATE